MINNKRFQSLIITLTIATAAVGGLFILMTWLATPQTPMASNGTVVATPLQPTLTKTESTARPPEISKNPDNSGPRIVATVNGESITEQTWQESTRLDAVMSQFAKQPLPTAEETLDRLINEIIVLKASGTMSLPTEEEVENKISVLQTSWQVTNQEIITALAKTGLQRIDLVRRVSRLIQIQTALVKLSSEKGDLNVWLAQTRGTAKIELYHPLTATSPKLVESTESGSGFATMLSEPSPESGESRVAVPESGESIVGMSTAPYPENIAPDFTLVQLKDNSPLTLSSLRGKPTIINFWATWCPPCRRELPALQTAYMKYKEQLGFVAVDVKEDALSVAAFANELGLTYPIVLDQDGQISEAKYEIRGFPTTIFVDARGVVAVRHVGPLDESSIDSYLIPLLEQANKQKKVESPTAQLSLAPSFVLTDADGSRVSLQDYRDKSMVVLVFHRGQT